MTKRILSVILAAVLLVSLVIPAASALSAVDINISASCTRTDKDYTLQRISNPESGQREADGLIPGGDRETSYAWCMEDRGDYIYIGTNKNIGGLVADALIAAFKANGIDEETVWAIGNVLTNGEVPRPETEEGGYILRCDKNTGEIVKLYTAPKNVSFRMAIRQGNNIYFGSYAADAVSSNDILRIDENDNIETVFSSTNGTSMRAACLMDDKLYFGGVDESYALAEGDAGCKKLAILEKDDNDDSVWNRVADYKDFGKRYAMDPGVQGNITSPIWDICSLDGYIYATVPNASGFAMFKGHPAADGEEANEYGWHWEEVIGFFNGVNNIGLCDDPAGYTGAQRGMLSVTATPFVFNNELYVMDFDMTIYSEIYAVRGILNQLMKKEGQPSQYLASLYETMRHPQSVWKMDSETGVFVKSEGFSKAADNPCTEYLWRTAVYDGELYITTMDSATIYNYITRLTNCSFLKMTPEEMSDQLNYIKQLVELISAKTEEAEIEEGADGLREVADGMVNEITDMDLNPENAEEYVECYCECDHKIKELVAEIKAKIAEAEAKGRDTVEQLKAAVDALKTKLITIYNNIDWKGLEMYAYISNAVKDDVWGFEMYKTADGENYEAVTIDGFGDKYNYGGRTLLATDKGLYIGTANPFYGTQLWLLTNVEEEESGINGDANHDGVVDIVDVTTIQRFKVEIKLPGKLSTLLSDVDGDGQVCIIDAAWLQRWIVRLSAPEGIGKPI